MRSQHKRFRYRGGTQDACGLPADKGLPKRAASADDLVRYQEQHVANLRGGFDPRQLLSGKAQR